MNVSEGSHWRTCFSDSGVATPRDFTVLSQQLCCAGQGGKSVKRGARVRDDTKRELVMKSDGFEYAKVVRVLGGLHLIVQCFDGKSRMAVICGKLVKRVWINAADIILVALREYEDGKCEAVLKYTSEEARQLKACGELPSGVTIGGEAGGDADDGVEFGAASDSDASVDIAKI